MIEQMGLDMLSAPTSRTLSDHVAQRLREAILSGQLKPGQRVVEHEIAAAMQMSRGPVRDALKLLEHERLVVRYPYRGTFVAWLTRRDAEEIYSLRGALEGLAVDYAIRSATDEQIDELDKIVDVMAAEKDQAYTEFSATDVDLAYHDMLFHISNHTRAHVAWRSVRVQVRLLILSHRTLQPTDFRDLAVEYHRLLTAAIRQRDAEKAQSVLKEHLASSFNTVASSFAEHPMEFVEN
ncbi:MAG: GntR family transcriptional regulator [Anaerolineae bacterium]